MYYNNLTSTTSKSTSSTSRPSGSRNRPLALRAPAVGAQGEVEDHYQEQELRPQRANITSKTSTSRPRSRSISHGAPSRSCSKKAAPDLSARPAWNSDFATSNSEDHIVATTGDGHDCIYEQVDQHNKQTSTTTSRPFVVTHRSATNSTTASEPHDATSRFSSSQTHQGAQQVQQLEEIQNANIDQHVQRLRKENAFLRKRVKDLERECEASTSPRKLFEFLVQETRNLESQDERRTVLLKAQILALEKQLALVSTSSSSSSIPSTSLILDKQRLWDLEQEMRSFARAMLEQVLDIGAFVPVAAGDVDDHNGNQHEDFARSASGGCKGKVGTRERVTTRTSSKRRAEEQSTTGWNFDTAVSYDEEQEEDYGSEDVDRVSSLQTRLTAHEQDSSKAMVTRGGVAKSRSGLGLSKNANAHTKTLHQRWTDQEYQLQAVGSGSASSPRRFVLSKESVLRLSERLFHIGVALDFSCASSITNKSNNHRDEHDDACNISARERRAIERQIQRKLQQLKANALEMKGAHSSGSLQLQPQESSHHQRKAGSTSTTTT
ncbi:unnamed protein product, partial [Amoebophrya sp. A25]|eukprot:GSA25T00014960001.1